jgi:hypothetical protein
MYLFIASISVTGHKEFSLWLLYKEGRLKKLPTFTCIEVTVVPVKAMGVEGTACCLRGELEQVEAQAAMLPVLIVISEFEHWANIKFFAN